jgi:hypothetical protein
MIIQQIFLLLPLPFLTGKFQRKQEIPSTEIISFPLSINFNLPYYLNMQWFTLRF